MADDELAYGQAGNAGDGDALAGADVVGGAVVPIRGDISDLEAKDKQAKAIAEDVNATTATLRITASTDDLVSTIAGIPRLTSGGGNRRGVKVDVTLDDAAVGGQIDALLARVQAELSRRAVGVVVNATPGGFSISPLAPASAPSAAPVPPPFPSAAPAAWSTPAAATLPATPPATPALPQTVGPMPLTDADPIVSPVPVTPASLPAADSPTPRPAISGPAAEPATEPGTTERYYVGSYEARQLRAHADTFAAPSYEAAPDGGTLRLMYSRDGERHESRASLAEPVRVNREPGEGLTPVDLHRGTDDGPGRYARFTLGGPAEPTTDVAREPRQEPLALPLKADAATLGQQVSDAVADVRPDPITVTVKVDAAGVQQQIADAVEKATEAVGRGTGAGGLPPDIAADLTRSYRDAAPPPRLPDGDVGRVFGQGVRASGSEFTPVGNRDDDAASVVPMIAAAGGAGGGSPPRLPPPAAPAGDGGGRSSFGEVIDAEWTRSDLAKAGGGPAGGSPPPVGGDETWGPGFPDFEQSAYTTYAVNAPPTPGLFTRMRAGLNRAGGRLMKLPGFGRALGWYAAFRGAKADLTAAADAFAAADEVDPVKQAADVAAGQAAIREVQPLQPLGTVAYRAISATVNKIFTRNGLESDAAYGERVGAAAAAENAGVESEELVVRQNQRITNDAEGQAAAESLPTDYARRKAERELRRQRDVRETGERRQRADLDAEASRKGEEDAALANGRRGFFSRAGRLLSYFPGRIGRGASRAADIIAHDAVQPQLDAATGTAVRIERSNKVTEDKAVAAVNKTVSAEQSRDEAAETARKRAETDTTAVESATNAGDKFTAAVAAADKRVTERTEQIRKSDGDAAAETYAKGVGRQTIERAGEVAGVEFTNAADEALQHTGDVEHQTKQITLRRDGRSDEAELDAVRRRAADRTAEATRQYETAKAKNDPNAAELGRTVKATEAEGAAEVLAKQEELGRRRVEQAAQTAERVKDIETGAAVATMEANHQTYEADAAAYARAQDAKLAKAKALRDAQAPGSPEYQQAQQVVTALQAARPAEDAAFARRQQERHDDAAGRSQATVDASLDRLNHLDFAATLKEFDEATKELIHHADAADAPGINRARSAERQAMTDRHEFELGQTAADLTARKAAADQRIEGRPGEADATMHIRGVVRDFQNATPELKGQAADTAIEELKEAKSELTGMHGGGGIVHSSADPGKSREVFLESFVANERNAGAAAEYDRAIEQIQAELHAPAKELAPPPPLPTEANPTASPVATTPDAGTPVPPAVAGQNAQATTPGGNTSSSPADAGHVGTINVARVDVLNMAGVGAAHGRPDGALPAGKSGPVDPPRERQPGPANGPQQPPTVAPGRVSPPPAGDPAPATAASGPAATAARRKQLVEAARAADAKASAAAEASRQANGTGPAYKAAISAISEADAARLALRQFDLGQMAASGAGVRPVPTELTQPAATGRPATPPHPTPAAPPSGRPAGPETHAAHERRLVDAAKAANSKLADATTAARHAGGPDKAVYAAAIKAGKSEQEATDAARQAGLRDKLDKQHAAKTARGDAQLSQLALHAFRNPKVHAPPRRGGNHDLAAPDTRPDSVAEHRAAHPEAAAQMDADRAKPPKHGTRIVSRGGPRITSAGGGKLTSGPPTRLVERAYDPIMEEIAAAGIATPGYRPTGFLSDGRGGFKAAPAAKGPPPAAAAEGRLAAMPPAELHARLKAKYDPQPIKIVAARDHLPAISAAGLRPAGNGGGGVEGDTGRQILQRLDRLIASGTNNARMSSHDAYASGGTY